MWHASAAGRSGAGSASEAVLLMIALDALDEVGDAMLGEWHEWNGYAYHIRRRLSAVEQLSVGPAIDVRGTPEGARRTARMQRFLPITHRGIER